jgi:hypothetical protein
MKKKQVAFTVADKNNLPYAQMMINSLRKFHAEEELPLIVMGEEVAKLHKDPAFFYKAAPLLGLPLLDEYELVLKLDSDQLIFGKLDHILYDTSYDVGCVLNINRVDPPTYGIVSIQGVQPNEYYNNGLVAMRSKDFVSRWLTLCNSKYFDRFQYREQDILNILAHFGGFNVKSLDSDAHRPTWNGLVSKGETIHAELKDGQVIIPRGKDNYPDQDTVLKVWHQAGGGEKKMNFRIHFNESIINYINWLISDTTKPYEL